MGKLLLGKGWVFLAPHGIHVLLTQSQIPLLGKHVVIVGRSNIVEVYGAFNAKPSLQCNSYFST